MFLFIYLVDSIGQLSDVQYDEFERARLQLQEDNDYDVRQCAGVVTDKRDESKYSDVVPWPEIDDELEKKTDAEYQFYSFYQKTGIPTTYSK